MSAGESAIRQIRCWWPSAGERFVPDAESWGRPCPPFGWPGELTADGKSCRPWLGVSTDSVSIGLRITGPVSGEFCPVWCLVAPGDSHWARRPGGGTASRASTPPAHGRRLGLVRAAWPVRTAADVHRVLSAQPGADPALSGCHCRLADSHQALALGQMVWGLCWHWHGASPDATEIERRALL